MSHIKHYWLASYPKSGNTWLRLFLSRLSQPDNTGVDINNIKVGLLASNRTWVEQSLGIDITELSDDEVDTLRPLAYRWWFESIKQTKQCTHQFHKIHDAYRTLPSGQSLISDHAAIGTVYIVRNPLDVAVSGANHASISLDEAIESICDRDFTLSNTTNSLSIQLRQYIGDWSSHVNSWLEADIEKLIVRYEDMSQYSTRTFQRIAQFLELPADYQTVTEALAHCSFSKVQQQENDKGFKEKSHAVANFFRKGIVGDWSNHLSENQVNTIVNRHRAMMLRMGYLDSNYEPIPMPLNSPPEFRS